MNVKQHAMVECWAGVIWRLEEELGLFCWSCQLFVSSGTRNSLPCQSVEECCEDSTWPDGPDDVEPGTLNTTLTTTLTLTRDPSPKSPCCSFPSPCRVVSGC